MTDAVEIDTNAILDAVARLDYARAPLEGRKVFIRHYDDIPLWLRRFLPRMILGCTVYVDSSLAPGQFKVIG